MIDVFKQIKEKDKIYKWKTFGSIIYYKVLVKTDNYLYCLTSEKKIFKINKISINNYFELNQNLAISNNIDYNFYQNNIAKNNLIELHINKKNFFKKFKNIII